MPTEGVILSGILEFEFVLQMSGKNDSNIRNRTVVGWHAGESRLTSAEGESGKPRISQAKGQR